VKERKKKKQLIRETVVTEGEKERTFFLFYSVSALQRERKIHRTYYGHGGRDRRAHSSLSHLFCDRLENGRRKGNNRKTVGHRRK